MFPAAWDEARLKSEVDAAWNSPTKTVAGTQWSARTPSGVKVKGYTYPRVTVYPGYEP
jgi:filamentous hemagglutinin